MMYLLFKGQVSIANFTLYIMAIATFTQSLNTVVDQISDIRRFAPYYQAAMKFMNLPKTIREGQGHHPFPAQIKSIEFDNVGFCYLGSDKWALRHVSCQFKGRQTISIVGENGAGKSTFIKLLCRLYEPSEGRILLNGVDIREYDYDEYVGHMSVVFQDYQLFSVSIGQNLSLEAHYDSQKAQTILEGLGLWSVVEKQAHGLDTRVHKAFDVSGFEPSGGQGQKLAIARALYHDSPIVILDEPTAALDPRAEYEIYQDFSRLVSGKLAFYISHRLSSARFCDEILVFEKGQLIERGNHESLYAQKGLYHDLYQMQAHYYQDV